MRCFYVFFALLALVSVAHAKLEPAVRDLTPSQNIQADDEPDVDGLAAQAISALNEGDIDEALGPIYEEGIPTADQISSDFSLFGSSAFLAASSVIESATKEAPSAASALSTWGSSIRSKTPTWLHNHTLSSTVKGAATSVASVASEVPTGLLSSDGVNSPETPGILVTPSSQPQDVVPVSSTSQLTTGTSSGNGALGSLMHYKTNDHFVEILSLLLAGLAGAGAALL